MKCFLPSEQWYLGQMPATFSPDFPALAVFFVESQVAFGGEARELGRYGAATQLAKRGGST